MTWRTPSRKGTLCGMWGDMNSFLEQADLAFKQRRKSSFRERGGGSVHLGSWQMFYFSTLFPHETHLCSFHWIQPDTALHIFPLKASPWCTTQTLSSKSHSWGTPQWPQLCVQCSPSIDISLVFRKKERKKKKPSGTSYFLSSLSDQGHCCPVSRISHSLFCAPAIHPYQDKRSLTYAPFF